MEALKMYITINNTHYITTIGYYYFIFEEYDQSWSFCLPDGMVDVGLYLPFK